MKIILAIDDQQINLITIKAAIETNLPDCKVLTAMTGKEGIELARKEQPETILLDIVMPIMDGFEVCKRLKEEPLTKHIPVVMITAIKVDKESRVKGLETGADAFLSKPIDPDELAAQINVMLRIKEAEDKLRADKERLNQMVQERTKELEERNEELDAFSHTVAHDLKNPIGIIMNFSNLLLDDDLQQPKDEVLNYLSIIAKSGTKALQIVNSLLLFASLRKAEVNTRRLNMGVIIAESIKRLSLMIEENNAVIKLSNAWPDALGYAPWIEEVWLNFLSNALKYGGKPAQIEIGADVLKINDVQKEMVRFWVRDYGPGISADHQKLLFKSFERLDQVKTEGYGLGLSIVHRIVEKLDGYVGLESEVGNGSLFYFALPAYSKKGEKTINLREQNPIA